MGLMSGTSLDGIDAAVVEFTGAPLSPAWRLLAFVDLPYTAEQRRMIHDGILEGTAASLCRLNVDLGEWFADAALRACREAGVDSADVAVIGSHGQTVWHEPPRDGRRGATLQIGCAATIAERTGIAVVSDFRARDVAAGGHGAPLVPWVDRLLFSHPAKRRVLQNVGGMANLSWLPPQGSDEPVLAFDTGPGNALIDAAVELATGGDSTYDRDGAWAAAGEVNEVLLNELLAHPFLNQPPPRSTGRELFGRPFVQDIADRVRPGDRSAWASFISTMTSFTARSIADAITRWAVPLGVDEIIITGGGALNPTLVERIRERLAPIPVAAGSGVLGIDPAAKEALAFAALARAHLSGVPGNVPEATGAAGPRVLGCLTPGRER
ncbi:MAG: anhydro-N-acetylmuramic acid kinase [Gemmatimonadota bacterium]